MSSVNVTQTRDNENKTLECTINKKVSINKTDEKKMKHTKYVNTKPCKYMFILPIVLGVSIMTGVAIAIIIILKKMNRKNGEKDMENEETEEIEENFKPNNFGQINKNNYIKTKVYEDFIIPSDRKLRVLGEDFQYKNSTFIIDKNEKIYIIDDNGIIEGVTKNDFPLYYYFNETITNGSYLFKDVKCFKEIDLSKMDSSKMIDASNMFENSSFEEIYFGTENESYTANSEYINESKTAEIQESLNNNSESKTKTRYLDENLDNTQEITEDSEEEKRKEYFDTTKIKSVNEIFMNCRNLKKIQLPPSFNVGKNAKGMFKGCYNLEDVNTSLISSTEIEQMESMFEDCQSLKEISFSNNFLTGEVKSLNNVFKNTNLSSLDLSYLRLFNLENYSNIFDGASIKGSLKIGKYYSNNNTRDNLLKEIAKVTDSNTTVFTTKGTMIDKIFQDIYYNEKNVEISINVVDIDYNIHYKKMKIIKYIQIICILD